jgi:hypothetical protein
VKTDSGEQNLDASDDVVFEVDFVYDSECNGFNGRIARTIRFIIIDD